MNHYGNFQDVVRYLKKHLPPAHDISVRRVRWLRKDRLGEIYLKESEDTKSFNIRINGMVDNDLAVILLLHEWAHAICWQEGTKIPLDDHGPEWGVAYSRVYLSLQDYCWQ